MRREHDVGVMRCVEHGMQPVWINKNNLNEIELTQFDTLVVEKCEETSINQLTIAKCCIIDPENLISFSCATQDRSPVSIGVMRDLCICTSCLCFEDKAYIQALVKMMSGNFTTDLDDKVTHLITSSVLSVEYEKAIRMKIHIVKKEWVKAIWEANMTDYVDPDDKRFDKYKVPMFYNLVVTTTNVQRYEKEEIARLIRDNGGIYMNALDLEIVNIVLAPENSEISPKIRYARGSGIVCLTLNWLYESARVGHVLPFRYYIFETVKEHYFSRILNVCETPSYSTNHTTYDKEQDNYIDETAFETSTIRNVSTFSTVATVLDRPAFYEADAAGPFLYGCVIYLAGFTSDQKDKLNRILRVGSAMPFDYVCDILTHIIVGDEDSAASDLKLLKSGGLCPYVLTLEWLEESIKLKRRAPLKNFLYKREDSTLQKVMKLSSSSITNSQLLQDRMSEEGEQSSNLGEQERQNAIVSTTGKTVQEYLKQCTHPSIQTPESLGGYITPPETDNNSDTINYRLFEGLTFVVSDFCDMNNDVLENIIAMNGKVVPDTFIKIPDYGIVPRCGMTLNCTVKEIVTDLFIEDCIRQDRIVDIMYYHRPISVTNHVLLGCVLTISTYTGVERSYLVTLAMELGATYQDVFTCEMIIGGDMYKNTHLVCSVPEGKNYNVAVRSKIPVVTAEWLKACAAQLTRVDETPFLVVKSLAPSKGPKRPMETDICSFQTNTKQIVFSTEPIASSSKIYNIIVPEEYFLNLEVQNNTFDNMQSPNNEYSLPMNTTSESSATLFQEFRSIPSSERERSPLKRPFSTPVSILKDWQEVDENLSENNNAGEI
ncbi:DNA topoisomerase 2-binding protein 1-like isoform X2 [Bombus pyrosoma]|uniref:DNA topoisomerase 2-binding protein 1-like isoform X2 n=1 Tax=Bombus pyrosoma TaxID=396416 RepID=UPI001CB8CD83|nr:DNA topoisomerase 2-binding protein 1-like isoform X2 [Bombus pyrosoma]